MSSLDHLRAEFSTALGAARSVAEVKAVRDHFLSRKHGVVTALVKRIASSPVEHRPALGAAAKALKRDMEVSLETRELELMAGEAP